MIILQATVNENYLLIGPAELKVVNGIIEMIGAKIMKGETVVVPYGKRVPFQVLENVNLEIDADESNVVKIESTSIPNEWNLLVDRIISERIEGRLYKIIILGEVDTGKTFFSTYLANKLLEKNISPAILDCDTGQSDIGPPGTFGMLVLKKQVVFLSEETPTYLYMIGSHSPGLHLLPAMTGLVYMLKKAEKDASILIIDTTGWVQGDGGRSLKKAKLDIVDPDLVVLLQRSNELEHLVRHLPDKKLVRLPVSKKASPTSQFERKQLRELVSKKYFKDSRVINIPFDKVFTDRCYFLTGTKINLPDTLHAERLSGWEGTLVITSCPVTQDMVKSWPSDLGTIRNFIAGEEVGVMVALLDAEQNCLAIGRVEAFDFLNNTFRIRTPYKGDVSKIAGLQFGSLKISEKGEEAGFIEPGSF